jgi:hypothetical protein
MASLIEYLMSSCARIRHQDTDLSDIDCGRDGNITYRTNAF